MVEHRTFSSVSGYLGRCCLGIAVIVLCGLPGASAQSASAGAGVNLKLDWDLVPRIGTPGVSRSELLAAKTPELRGRILKVRDQVAALEHSNAQKSSYLNHHEELIQRMSGVVAAQEKVIARLAAEIQQPMRTALAQAPVMMPRAATLPRPQGSVAVAPIRLGPIELPGRVRNYLMEGAFAGVAIILLGWAFYLRSVARARTAELIILKGGRSAAPTPASEAEPEAPAETLEPEPLEPEPLPVARLDPEPAPVEKRKPAEAPAPAPIDDDEKLEEAKRIINAQESKGPAPAEPKQPETPEPRKPVAASGQRPQAPPLILDLEVDDETIDFFTDISFDIEDETDKKG